MLSTNTFNSSMPWSPAQVLATRSRADKDRALHAMADALVEHTAEIVAANKTDIEHAELAGTPAAITAAPGSSAAAASREAVDPASGLPWVDLSDLPVEAAETLAAIVRLHFPTIKEQLLTTALTQFFELREVPGLKKKPSTSEVLDWLKLILAEDLSPEDLRREGKHRLPKLHGALLKNEQDVQLFERLAFLNRGGRG